MSKNILYLVHTVPYPANDGGDQGHQSHINLLRETKYIEDIKFFFVEMGDRKVELPINFEIFKRAKDSKIVKYIKKALYLLFSKYPYGYHSVCSKDIIQKIKEYNPGVIVQDGLPSSAIIDKVIKQRKLIYISNNIEYQYWYDVAKLETNRFLKPWLYLFAYRTKQIEKSILKKADKIVCVSTSDYKIISKEYPDKTILCPHKIEMQEDQWNCPKEKTLFFCGPLDFQPNYDAVEWLVTELAPVLPKDIKIKIAGKNSDSVPDDWKKDNVEFLGFVSKEDLYDLYKNSSAFICPIIYGSGVKIKVTEALSYSAPVIATKEALEGLDYLDIKPIIDRDNLEITKCNIESLLDNENNLLEYSKEIRDKLNVYQNGKNIGWNDIIGDIIKEEE